MILTVGTNLECVEHAVDQRNFGGGAWHRGRRRHLDGGGWFRLRDQGVRNALEPEAEFLVRTEAFHLHTIYGGKSNERV
eukprot:9476561-Pyramimonas_sp.AAC.1